MYTVVLMAALTTTPSTQAWHRGCARGCHGCHGYVAANTCWYGGGHGWGCYGCHGCYANPWNAASFTSGSYGNGVFQPGAYHHGAYHPGVFQCHGCYGCYGGWSCYGYPMQHAVIEPAPPSGVPERKTETKPGKTLEEAPLPKTPTPKKNGEQARARVIVDVPVDAALFVDGQRMNGSSSRRVFQTPELIPGRMYYYELRAEVVRDGQIITANQRLILSPGQSATASFADLGRPTNAAARANGQ